MRKDRMKVYTACLTLSCPNYAKIACHPRSKIPEICGMCGNDVRIFSARKRITNSSPIKLTKVETSIGVSRECRDMVNTLKEGDETAEDVLRRLVGMEKAIRLKGRPIAEE